MDIVEVEKRTAFFEEYKELCERHGFTLAPLDDGDFKPNFHDSLLVIPIDDEAKEYIRYTAVYQDEKGFWF